MADVKIIKKGYSNWISPARQHADGTITFIKGKHKVIVDTGLPQDKDIIIEELKKERLTPEDIGYVVCTHGHSDHIGNNNLFPNATFIVSYDISVGDLYTFHDFSKQPYVIDDEIKVISTPGHSYQDISVLVTTNSGVVAVVGDLFEKEEDLQNKQYWSAFSEWPEKQIENREKILQIADFIVPGHGDIFVVNADNIEEFRAEKHHQKIKQINKTILNTPLHQLPIETLAVVVEDAMKNLDNPNKMEKNPINTIFSSLYNYYKRPHHAKFTVVSNLLKSELNEFQNETNIIRDNKRRIFYINLLNFRYLERFPPEDVWKKLNISKTPYYNHLKSALHGFSEFLRKRELLKRNSK